MKRTLLFILSLLLIILAACGDIEEPTSDEVVVTPPGTANDQGYPEPSENRVEEGIAPPVETPPESGYPAPSQEGDSAAGAYPGPDSDSPGGDGAAYPSPSQTSPDAYPAPDQIDESKRFTIEGPLAAGQQTVSGTGVAGISIKVVSISNAGEQLGFGVVTEEGEFTINLSRPGEGGELLGLQFADDSTAATLEGVPGTDMPMMGLVLAQALVDR